MGHSKDSPKRKVYSHERSQINYLILYLKLLEKQEQAKPKTSRSREVIKISPKLMK
jgi:hypothetical protein